jgi:hypothetical protein
MLKSNDKDGRFRMFNFPEDPVNFVVKDWLQISRDIEEIERKFNFSHGFISDGDDGVCIDLQ